jgi:hypothetical protein
MKIRLLSLITLAILTMTDFAVAETMSFQTHNFTIELPPTWTAINPTLNGTLFTVQSSDGEKVFFANAVSVPENKGASDGLPMMIAGFKNADQHIVAERQQTVNNLSFTVFTSQVLGKKETATTWFAATAAEVYMLGGIHKSGDVNTDQELLSIINSFHLISPVQTISQNSPTDSMAFRLGCIFGAVIVVIFFIRLKNSKKRNA